MPDVVIVIASETKRSRASPDAYTEGFASGVPRLRSELRCKSSTMPGHFALILHAHLPFARHLEHEHFIEEEWLFKAITEAYIPLLRAMQRPCRRLCAVQTHDVDYTDTLCNASGSVVMRALRPTP